MNFRAVYNRPRFFCPVVALGMCKVCKCTGPPHLKGAPPPKLSRVRVSNICLCVKSKALQFFISIHYIPPPVIDPLEIDGVKWSTHSQQCCKKGPPAKQDCIQHNCKWYELLCNFLPKRSLYLSPPIVGALEVCKPYRTSLELLILKGYFLPITFMISCAK